MPEIEFLGQLVPLGADWDGALRLVRGKDLDITDADSALTSLAAGDLFLVDDISDSAGTGTQSSTKKITAANIKNFTDQTLPTDFVSAASGGSFSGAVTMGSGLKLQFVDANEYVSGNGTDLTIASGNNIDLLPAGGVVTITDDDIAEPNLVILSTADSQGSGGLVLQKDRGSAGTNADVQGIVTFKGQNSNDDDKIFAQIIGAAPVVDDGNEEGQLNFRVLTANAAFGGSLIATGLLIDGTTTNDQVDVTIAAGAASTTAVLGNLTTVGTINGYSLATMDTNIDAKLNTSGGAVTGFLTLHDDPTSDLHAATKQYVDAQDLTLIDEDTMATDSATRPPSQQSVKAYVDTSSYHYIVANFYSSSTSTGFFLPLIGGNVEITTPGASSGERFGMITPFDGTLEKVIIRCEERLRHDVLVEIVIASNDTEIPDTVTGSLNADFSGTPLSDDTPYTYDFTGVLTSGNNAFYGGRVLAIRLTPGGGFTGDCYCTCVLKYDTTT